MSNPTLTAPQHLTLADCFKVDPERFNRVPVIRQPGLQVLHLTLAPAQAVPRHNHPGYHVVLQGLGGILTVQVDDEEMTLKPGQLLYLAGHRQVAPSNDGKVPAAMLITLAKLQDVTLRQEAAT